MNDALAAFDDLFGDDSSEILGGLPVTLDRAALAVSRVLQPHLEVDAVLRQLDELADACPARTRDGVIDHLFGSGRLVGDRDTYGHWHNSCIDRVIDRGKGMPITLAVVTIEVARRVGVPIIGIGMPGHFLVGDPTDPDWYADLFNGGTRLDRDGCREVFAGIGGDPRVWRPEFLDPSAPRDIILRMLNNLRSGFDGRGDQLRLALVMRMRLAIPELADDEQRNAARSMAIFN